MDLLIQYTYRASRKEPLGTLLRRLHEGMVAASLPVEYEFAFCDSPLGGGVSAVDRAVKKFPQLAPLVTTSLIPGMAGPAPKMIGGHETDLPFGTLAELADGVPRSLPFHALKVRFTGPAFGVGPAVLVTGVVAGDSWWVNGRQRSLTAYFVVPEAPKPAPEGALAVFLGILGKPAKTNCFQMSPAPAPAAESRPETRSALVEITKKYRAKLPELVAEAGMPHTLPSRMEALTNRTGYDQNPYKPTLEQYFKPLGYSCKGGSGTFSLRRRTPANNVVEVDLDVGTWSRSVTAFFKVHGPGFRCTLPMPVAPGLDGGQYPIGNAERWEKIVENLAVLSVHLNRQVVPEIDSVAGPAPQWFDAPK